MCNCSGSLGALTTSSAQGNDDPWYVDAANFVVSWVTGRSGSGSKPNDWRQYYAEHLQGTVCQGAPDPALAARAAQLDPAGAAVFRDHLSQGNEGRAPTVQEMAITSAAHLWVMAVMGGNDCRNNRYPGDPDALRNWVAATVDGGVYNIPDTTRDDSWFHETLAGLGQIVTQLTDRELSELRSDLLAYARQKYGELPPHIRAQIFAETGAQAPGAGLVVPALLAVGAYLLLKGR